MYDLRLANFKEELRSNARPEVLIDMSDEKLSEVMDDLKGHDPNDELDEGNLKKHHLDTPKCPHCGCEAWGYSHCINCDCDDLEE